MRVVLCKLGHGQTGGTRRKKTNSPKAFAGCRCRLRQSERDTYAATLRFRIYYFILQVLFTSMSCKPYEKRPRRVYEYGDVEERQCKQSAAAIGIRIRRRSACTSSTHYCSRAEINDCRIGKSQ